LALFNETQEENKLTVLAFLEEAGQYFCKSK